ncbi:MAG: DUF1786 domain-containing protein [Anaerolineales bacterium]
MKILTVDVGTGTQDVLLYDSRLDLENGFKLVLPSPTMMIHNRIREATRRGETLLLTGQMMGGGPSAWAARDHARAGLPIFATPEAAKTIDDELEKVEKMGIRLISEDEAARLPSNVQSLTLKDFDFPLLSETFARFGISLTDLAAVCVAVFDHGDSPPGISDRQFRFDYLDERIREENALTAFAYLADDIPPIMTRLQAVADSAQKIDAPLLVMDTAPAAILGATFDPQVAARPRKLIANIGNFHCLAFRLGETGIEGVFEHHTGEINLPKLESLLLRLANGTLTHQDVFDDMGHGALVYDKTPLELRKDGWDVAVTGPRRALFHPDSRLRPYFAVPFGDMMMAGNFGLLAAAADLLPEQTQPLRKSLSGIAQGTAPWDTEN